MVAMDSAGMDDSTLSQTVRQFRPGCPGCTPDVTTAVDARPCSFYDCPGLPAELHVTCDLCMYDFAAQDGQPSCDHSTCETALRLRANVETYRKWIQLLKDEAAAQG